MVGLVIVSHSSKIAEGITDLTAQIAAAHKGIIAAGGMEDGEIGTDAVRISEAIKKANDGDGVVVLADLGSGIMSAETAIELLDVGSECLSSCRCWCSSFTISSTTLVIRWPVKESGPSPFRFGHR